MKEIPFLQLNLHRAAGAAIILNNELERGGAIGMITEPCTAFNKVTSTPSTHVSLPSVPLQDRPRAAIFIPRTINHVFLEQLSNRDCVVALIDTEQGKILIASIYLDYNLAVVRDWLIKLMDYADRKHIPLIWSFDCNAHSQLYGPNTNNRGKVFAEFILSNGLHVENRGDSPTYHAFRHGENIDTYIDVTLSKGLVPLLNWRVRDMAFNGSDHHTISWTLPLEINLRAKVRPWKMAKWKILTKRIDDHDFHTPEQLSTRKVDKLLKRWYDVINTALNKACPKHPARLSPIEREWYGKQHRFLKNRAKRKYLAHRRSTCPKKRKAFVRAKRAYNRACIRGKRESSSRKPRTSQTWPSSSKLRNVEIKEPSIPLYIKADGSLTDPGAETIAMLTDTHFPAAQPGTTPYKHDNSVILSKEEIEESHDWIDEDLVRKAMNMFKPNKAPGPDGLKPLVFRYLPHNAIEVLTLIFKASISFGHTPKLWRETKVIFLPKPGKATYDALKSYRPISLSNFLLKTLERLVVWKMEKDMEDYPIHAMQHGFTKGQCTESAISNTIDTIKQHLFEKEHCLGIFLDISSAFDSISIHHIKQTLLEHNGSPKMVEWYFSYLGRRYLEVELHGEIVHLTTATGFPQGGVCSAKFWLIAFDEAIRIINSEGITGNGYADDCSALIGGTHPHNMIEKMQSMLDRLVNWGAAFGLRFNPQKTVAIMFTRATRKFNRLVRMDSQLIPYSRTVVYLGVTLDAELKWKDHILSKIKKAKGLLMKMALITRQYWGPKPKLIRWAYMGIVRPTLTYAAATWGHAVEDENIGKALRRLNSLGLRTVAKVPRSTSRELLRFSRMSCPYIYTS